MTGSGGMTVKGARWLILICLAVLTAGCAAERVNLRPLYTRRPASVGAAGGEPTHTEVNVLYPFFSLERSAERSYHAVRPLYNAESKPGEGYFRVQYLWPLGLQYTREGETWQHRFWPLFQHLSKWRSGTAEKVTSGLIFPFFWWGSRPPEGPYFAVFPLGGVMRGVLGDSFTFFAFPLASRYRKGSYTRHDVLWPFVSFGGALGQRAARPPRPPVRGVLSLLRRQVCLR